MHINHENLHRILFLDIETVSNFPNYFDLPDSLKLLWQRKALFMDKSRETWSDDDYNDIYQAKAGIFAEFGKIICISCGYLSDGTFRLKTIYNNDEEELLTQFVALINEYYPDPKNAFLCGHNIKEFDVPYLCRRMIIHNISLPNLLDISGKKPWQVEHLLDTLEMWKFGDFKNFTSLSLLSEILSIPSPKDDIDGSQVGQVYWNEQNLKRIADYCAKDVITTAKVFLRLNLLPPLEDDNITHVDE